MSPASFASPRVAAFASAASAISVSRTGRPRQASSAVWNRALAVVSCSVASHCRRAVSFSWSVSSGLLRVGKRIRAVTPLASIAARTSPRRRTSGKARAWGQLSWETMGWCLIVSGSGEWAAGGVVSGLVVARRRVSRHLKWLEWGREGKAAAVRRWAFTASRLCRSRAGSSSPAGGDASRVGVVFVAGLDALGDFGACGGCLVELGGVFEW